VRYHYERELAAEHAVGVEVLFPELLPAFLDVRELMMRIKIGLAETGEVFATTKYARLM